MDSFDCSFYTLVKQSSPKDFSCKAELGQAHGYSGLESICLKYVQSNLCQLCSQGKHLECKLGRGACLVQVNYSKYSDGIN